MRNAILISIVTAVLVIGSVAAYAGPPASGTWTSTAGQFDEGRLSSSWAIGGPGFVGAGNVLHAESWDGATFGVDWKILCPVVTNVNLLVDLVDGNGDGQRTYQIDYAGGTVHLGGTGPWAGGDPVYVGLIGTYYEFRTVQYVAFAVVGSVSNHSVSASLQGYSQSCVTWGIGNSVWLGSGGQQPGYPDYRDAACAHGPNNGDWGDVRDLTISVDGCPVSTEQSSWGAVKAIYRK